MMKLNYHPGAQGLVTPSPTQKRKHGEISEVQEKRRMVARPPPSDDEDEDDDTVHGNVIDKAIKALVKAAPSAEIPPSEDASFVNTETDNAEDVSIDMYEEETGETQVDEDDEYEDASVQLGEEEHQIPVDSPVRPTLNRVSSGNSQSLVLVDGQNRGGEIEQRAKPIYNHDSAPVPRSQERSATSFQAGAAEETVVMHQPGPTQVMGDTPRRRCPEFETLVLKGEEILYTVEIPFDVMDPILELMGEDEWTGRGARWTHKYENVTELDVRSPETPTGQLALHLQHALDMCGTYNTIDRALKQLELIGDFNCNDLDTIAGQVFFMERAMLPVVVVDPWDGKKEELAKHVIPLAVTVAFAIFLSGEDPEGPRVYQPMMPLKVLRQMVGIISELAMLLGSDGDKLSELCAVLIEDVTHAMDGVAATIVNDRKAAEAEKSIQLQKEKAAQALQRRKQQFISSVQTFLGEENRDTKQLSPRQLVDRNAPVVLEASSLAFENPIYNILVTEVRTRAEPRIDRLAHKTGCTVAFVWEMLDAILAEAKTMDSEGFPMPADMVRGFRALYG